MRILVADDHDLVRETIAAFLMQERLGEVLTAGSLREAVALVRQSGVFDLVLLDYDMPGMSGLDGLEQMRKVNEGRPVALMSGTVSPELARLALKSGAAGFVPKTVGSRSMLAAVRFMAAGEVFVPYEFLSQAGAEGQGPLTQRELEVLRGLCAGKSNKEIAADLQLQEATVKLHVKTLSRKLGARNRTQAAMFARDRKLV